MPTLPTCAEFGNEKAPPTAGFLVDRAFGLVVLEVAEQTQDLQVQPDERHGQAQGDSPGRLSGAPPGSSGRLVEIDEEAECGDSDADQREDDRQAAAGTQAHAFATADAEHRQHEVAEHQHQDADHAGHQEAGELA